MSNLSFPPVHTLKLSVNIKQFKQRQLDKIATLIQSSMVIPDSHIDIYYAKFVDNEDEWISCKESILVMYPSMMETIQKAGYSVLHDPNANKVRISWNL